MSIGRISRKQFLKLMGSSIAIFGLGLVGFGSATFNFLGNSKSREQIAYAANSWSMGPKTLNLAINAALLKSGKILYVGGSGNNKHNALGPFKAGILDPKTGIQNEILIAEDLFCSGQAQLPNGNILFAGGNLAYSTDTPDGKFRGLDSAYEFDVSSESFVKQSSMAHGRWYPTLVTLPDGLVFTTSGFDEFGCENRLTEIYNPDPKNWTLRFDPASSISYCVGSCSSQPGAGSPCYGAPNNGVNPQLLLYPRMHLMPNGLVAVCGQGASLMSYRPSTGRWYKSNTSKMVVGARAYGTSTLLPFNNVPNVAGRILLTGGSADSAQTATKVCEIVTPSDNLYTTRTIDSMNYARRHHNSVILPNGKIIIVGGTGMANDVDKAVYAAELFDPSTETWTILPAASVPRTYHSVALLMSDGRVWTASSQNSAIGVELRTEIFSPSYIFETRPIISGNLVGGAYSGTITIPTSDPISIKSVSLVRISTVTHAFNTDQRLLWLPIIGRTSKGVTVKAPLNSTYAPPGYYLIHVIDSAGTPSEGAFIKIPGLQGDITAPFVSITQPVDGSTVKISADTVTLKVVGSTSDAGGSGIVKVEAKSSDMSSFVKCVATLSDWSSWTKGLTITGTGIKTITARAKDGAGNISTVSININVLRR